MSFRNINNGTLKNVRESISTSGLFIGWYLFPTNCPISTICTAEYFLKVILSSYCFKRDNFLSDNVTLNLKHVYKNGHHCERSSDHGCDVRLVERLGPLPPDIHAFATTMKKKKRYATHFSTWSALRASHVSIAILSVHWGMGREW